MIMVDLIQYPLLEEAVVLVVVMKHRKMEQHLVDLAEVELHIIMEVELVLVELLIRDILEEQLLLNRVILLLELVVAVQEVLEFL